MKARTIQQYTKAVDLLEQMLNRDNADRNTQGFNHAICGFMKSAFADGINGKTAPGVIESLNATGKPFLRATAAVIEKSYNDGLKAREKRNG